MREHTAQDPQSADEKPLLLSIPQAAQLLGVGITFCWQLVRAGTLPSIRLGRRVLVPRTAIEDIAFSRKD